MAVERHPPKLIFRGDWEAGQNYVRPGKSELIRTAELADKMGAPQYKRTTLLDEVTGAYVITQVNGPFQQIHIVVPHKPIEAGEIPEVPDLITPELEEQIYVGIYSGFAYSYNIQWDYTDGPPPRPLDWYYRLHEFNPTEPCRAAYPDDFDPGLEYQPITRLIMEPDPDIRTFGGSSYHRDGFRQSWLVTNEGGDVEQSNLVHPCAYSGPMARAVSLALGNGNFNLLSADDRESLLDEHAHDWWTSVIRSTGFRIAYDWHYDRTHGALKDNFGQWWLVEISQYHGIIARRMPMIKYSFLPEDPEEQKAVQEFRGIPSGESFPNDTSEINDQIAAGNFIRLMDIDDYQTDFMDDQLFYSQACNWCFNDDGTEARVTTYNYEHENGWMQNAYWKLELSINKSGVGYSGSAVLTKIREDILADGRELRLNGSNVSSNFSHFPIYHYHPEDNATYTFNMATGPFTDHWDDIPDPQGAGEVAFDFPIWVGWIDGNWHEINYRMCKIVEYQKDWADARLWPFTEADPDNRKPSLSFTGRMPPAPGNPNEWSDPQWVLVSSYSPAFDLGTPVVDSGATKNGRWIDTNTTEAEWAGVTTRTGVGGDGRACPIHKIENVRQIWEHTEDWNPPTQYVDFIMVPYNRNAYFIRKYDQRDAPTEQYTMGRYVMMYPSHWEARNNDGDQVVPDGTGDPGWDSFDPGIDYNYTPGFGALGAGTLQYSSPSHDPDTGSEPDTCDTPPTFPPEKWYVDAASYRKINGIYNDWGPAEKFFVHYSFHLTTGWHPSNSCDAPDPRDELDWNDSVWPRMGGGSRKDGVHKVGTDVEEQHFWLVCDRSPVSSGHDPFYLGEADYEDDYVISPTDNYYVLQHAVVGKEGIIYSDVTKVFYDIPAGSPYFFVTMLHEGIMPEVKEGGFENYERRWLTFVGVNNP